MSQPTKYLSSSTWSLALLLSSCASRAAPVPTPTTVAEPAPQSEPAPETAPEQVEVTSPENLEPAPAEAEPFRLELLKPTEALEAVVLRHRGSGGKFETLSSLHDPCAASSADARCAQAARIAKAAERDPSAPSVYLLGFRADKAQLWHGQRELRQLLGRIDSAAEARLLLYAEHGIEPFCGVALAACERLVPDGYELRSVVEAPRCGPVKETVYVHHVATDGSIRMMQKRPIERDGRCTVP